MVGAYQAPAVQAVAAHQWYRDAHPYLDAPLKHSMKAVPELKGLEPAASQDPLPVILQKVGANVEAFFQNFVNVTSLEQIQESAPRGNHRQEFYYLALADRQGGEERLTEYRTDLDRRPVENEGAAPGFLLTRGFASLEAYLDLSHQAESTFRYLGRQSIDRRPCAVVGFAQHPDSASPLTFSAPGISFPVLVQGVVWISLADYQIVRIHTDLLAPQPQLQLKKIVTQVQYGPVIFPGSNSPLWLPSRVQVTLNLRGNSFRNLHLYSGYRLFEVKTLVRPYSDEKPQ
jgi:hypothetical protein